MIPQIIIICYFAFVLGMGLAKKEDIGYTFIGVLFFAGILYWGGFFDCFIK